MLKLESFFRNGQVPPYSYVWQHACQVLQDYLSRAQESNYPPADDEGDYFNAALDNVEWLRDMANAGDELDENEYRQWWVDFISCQADKYDVKYCVGGCDGDIRFDYTRDELLDMA